MRKFVKIILLLCILCPLVGLFLYSRAIDTAVSEEKKEKFFTIESGQGVKKIANNLFEEGFIKSKFFFEIYTWKEEVQSKLQAGEYLLSPHLSIKEIVGILTKGETVNNERTVKIIEGWNLADVDAYLSKNSFIGASESQILKTRLIKDWREPLGNPGIMSDARDNVDLEGYLYPDTYRVFKDATLIDIIKKMLANLDNKITPEMKAEIKKQDKTLFDIITMASIIEKEVNRDEDRAIVAGILYKRIEIGMRLEVDSTINYITGKNDPTANYKDLEIDSPYNTYKYYGLPPGPICNPGIASIKAAIYPEESPYLFYLHRQDTLETIFSKTFEEHIANKNRYLR